MIPDDILEDLEIDAQTLRSAWMSVLNDRERFVIEKRYSSDEPVPRSKIAPLVPRYDGSGKIGVGIDRTRQIENVALAKIRHQAWLKARILNEPA